MLCESKVIVLHLQQYCIKVFYEVQRIFQKRRSNWNYQLSTLFNSLCFFANSYQSETSGGSLYTRRFAFPGIYFLGVEPYCRLFCHPFSPRNPAYEMGFLHYIQSFCSRDIIWGKNGLVDLLGLCWFSRLGSHACHQLATRHSLCSGWTPTS